MRDNSIIFQEVKIMRMPGFEPPGFSVKDLKPQLNIIYGPNGIGKTTLARGMNGLLWPDAVKGYHANLKGRFTLNGSDWFVELDEGRSEYQKDGSPCSRPQLPPSQDRDRYYLALHELLQVGTEDTSLAQSILKESMGGYRIEEAAEKLGFKEKPARKGKNTELATQKIKEWQERMSGLEEIEKEEERLSILREELEESFRAQRDLEVTKGVIQFLVAEEDYWKAKRNLDLFPEAAGLLRGDELEDFNAIKASIQTCQEKIDRAQDRFSLAKKTIEDQRLPDKGVEAGFMSWLKNTYESLKSSEKAKEDLKTRLTGAEVERDKAASLLGDSISEEKLDALDSAVYDGLSHFARKAEDLKGSLRAFTYLKEILRIDEEPQEEGGIDEDVLIKGSQFLESWLKSPQSQTNSMKAIFFIFAFFVASLISVLGLILHPLYYLLLLIPFGLLFFGINQEQERKREGEAAYQQFQKLDLASPGKWEADAVRTRLLEIYRHLATIKNFQRRREYWADREAEYQGLKNTESELHKEKHSLISRYGLAPDTEERTLYFITNRLSRWQDAQSGVLSLTAQLQQKEDEYSHLLSRINDSLAEYGYQPVSDSAAVSKNITDLEERRESFLEGERNKKTASIEIEEGEERLKQAKDNQENLFTRLELTGRSQEDLLSLCQLKDDYQKVKNRLNGAEAVRNEKREELQKHSLFREEMLEEDLVNIRARETKLTEKANGYHDLYGSIKEIETRISLAKKENRLELALAEKELALDRLEDDLNMDYQQLTGHVLAEYIRDINTARSRPMVFQRAREILATITRGSYQLEVDGEHPPSFRAIETATGRGKSLEELSSGTRVQLLLAVRMAFVEREEQGITLPLYLDETLANTDDKRADAIIDAVIELTREGRQAFYFTAQESEVVKWVSSFQRAGNIEYGIIDLTKNQNDEGDFVMPEMERLVSAVSSIPSGRDLSHQEYAQELSLPGFNPHQGAGPVHLWYLIEDVEVLEGLLKTGVEKWSQLKMLLEMRGDSLFPEGKRGLCEDLLWLGRCLEEFIESWKVGRGRPVDRRVLLESDAISSTFIEEVSSLAKRLNGDGKKIIESLSNGEVSAFRTKKMEELEVYLQENGYIDPTPPLSLEEIRLRMLGSCEGHDLPRAGDRIDRLLNRLGILPLEIKT